MSSLHVNCVFCPADHNKTHAADVLHAVSYLMFEIIPEFSHEFSEGDDTKREWIVSFSTP